GRGGMARVLRAVDTKLRRELALKVTLGSRQEMPREHLARFVEEAQITAQLEHPNVMPMHDLGVDPDGHAYFSMKLIRGQSLESIIEKRQAGDSQTLAEFGLRRLLDVFLHVCQAMEYAHSRAVVHRDLKPGNVMVGDFGEVLVMDWGVAKLLDRPQTALAVSTKTDDLSESIPEAGPRSRSVSMPSLTSVRATTKAWETQVGEVIGTPQYMSPEQAQGLPIDERTDIYALGVMLYEILCGRVPFDEEDPQRTLFRLVTEAPERPSEINASVPLELEALALRLLEKDPAKRTLSLHDIRAHVLNYIEGIGRDYGREALWKSFTWSLGALVAFAFLVWYLTGRSIAKVLTLGPPAALNSVGWFLLIVAGSYPLWSVATLMQEDRKERDRFAPPTKNELFVSGFLAHRSFAAALAPLFQLVFIIQLVAAAASQATSGQGRSLDLVQRISLQMRVEWSQALIVILVFLFGYLFFLSKEVKFARRIDHYELLVQRPPWESVWPFFLVLVLLLTVTTTEVLDWTLSTPEPNMASFFKAEILARQLNVFEVVKTLVFQGTFLLGLTLGTMLAAFPFSELLAALRLTHQPADDAAVASRQQYFLRSLATFRVGRAVWLYGGAMIGSLTAITVLSEAARQPLSEKIVYILGPSLVGFLGYAVTRRYAQAYLEHAPAVQRLLKEQAALRRGQSRAKAERSVHAPWSWRLLQFAAPVVCMLAYLLWTGSGIHKNAVRELIIPVTTKDWLLILPYVLLVPTLLGREQLQRLAHRRPRATEPD
ncbi:MAG TPA: serine/threonine-protein kinase, partial [Polyangiaceae bacterium]|nr:serine/threonine-protein kinase [Polyangiaceae bacterium]